MRDAQVVLLRLPRVLAGLAETADAIARYADPAVEVYAGGRPPHTRPPAGAPPQGRATGRHYKLNVARNRASRDSVSSWVSTPRCSVSQGR